jgi:hypothetical protein
MQNDDNSFLDSLPGIAPWLRKVVLAKYVRLGLVFVAGLMMQKGWIVNADEWVALNAETITSAAAVLFAAVWSAFDALRRKQEAVIATQYQNWVHYGAVSRPANWIDVQDTIAARNAARKTRPGNYPPAPPAGGAMAVLLVFLLFTQTACGFWFGTSATDKFAQANKEVSAGVLEGLKLIRDLQKLAIISNEKAVPAALAFGRAMNVHRVFLNELVPYLQVGSDGKERLVLPADSIEKLKALLNSSIAATSNLVNDPAILNLDSATRAQIVAMILGFQPALQALVGLLAKLPKAKASAPSIRDSIPMVSISADLSARIAGSCRSALLAFGECDTLTAQIQGVK